MHHMRRPVLVEQRRHVSGVAQVAVGGTQPDPLAAVAPRLRFDNRTQRATHQAAGAGDQHH